MVSQKLKRGDRIHQGTTAPPEIFKLIDDLNIKIIKEMISRPDVSSTEIASKYKTPLSTIQRRRAKLEELVIKKQYTLDIRSMGWRLADLLITVEKGKAEETARQLLQDGKNNVVIASLRIGHPKVDVMAEVFYRDSEELHRLTENIKAMEYVSFVEWAEVVKVVGNNLSAMVDKVLANSK
jgi:DNA-binding Lrp family transcriptional regulator